MPFAQLVIGSPGSGKSTYCDGMQQLLTAIGRKASIVNLDPANDYTSYEGALDIRDLVSLEDVMEAEELGPNGGVLYALEELEHNIQWLEHGLGELGENYVLFDCPGQVELFTHHDSLRNVFFRLQKLGYRLVVINLMDSYTLTQPSLYISSLMLALRSMLQMDLTHLNVLTKIDNLASYPPLPLPLDFYTEARSLEYLVPFLEDEQKLSHGGAKENSKFKALNDAIIELIEDFGLVGFEPLAVEDRESMVNLLHVIDRASGYAFSAGDAEGIDATNVWQLAVREGGAPGKLDVRDVEERWITRRQEFDELERRMWEAEGKAERKQAGVDDPNKDKNPNSPGNKANDDSDDELMADMQLPAGQSSRVKFVRKT